MKSERKNISIVIIPKRCVIIEEINMKKKLYQEIAQICGANHRTNGTHKGKIWELQKLLPSGSGIDSGTKIDASESNDNKIVLLCDFHHMDENGYYSGWTNHKVIITPAFNGINIRITGRDRNSIKDYLHEVYDCALNEMVEFKEENNPQGEKIFKYRIVGDNHE